MASTLNLSTSEKNYGHSRRKTADTLTFQNQNNDLTEKTTRFDVYGHQITKSKHRHRVSFIDNISTKKLAEVILYENNTSNKDNANCQCEVGCMIF